VISAIAFIAALKKLPKDGKSLQNLNLNIFKDIVYIFKLFSGNVVYATLNFVALIASSVGFVIVYLMSLYLQVVMGYSSQIAGIFLIAQPLLMTMFSLYSGKLSDRVSPFKLATLGIIICTVGVSIGSFLNANYPLWLILSALVISGVGFGLFASPSTVAVMSCVEAKDYGTASAVLVTMRYFGYSSSVAVVSLIAGIFIGSVPLAYAEIDVLVKTMRTSFIVFTTFCAIGALLAAMCSIRSSRQQNVGN
jgi:MFS family permease